MKLSAQTIRPGTTGGTNPTVLLAGLAAFVLACGPSSTKVAPKTPPPAGGTPQPDAGTAPAPDAGDTLAPPPHLPTVVKTPTGVSAVVVGYRHSCAVMSSGAVRCWGYGGTGALGTGNRSTIGDDEPARAGRAVALKRRVSAAAIGMHTCALVEGGALHCWGAGRFGRLGYGNTNNIGDDEAPAAAGAVEVGAKVLQVATGAAHTCVLTPGGGVKCWGRGAEGRLGQGTRDDIGDDEKPSSVGSVKLGGKAVKVFAGGDHSCALMAGGKVRCWGANGYGQLGYGHTNAIGDDETPDSAGEVDVGGAVTDMALGGNHTCALLAGGKVRCWGWGGYGQLGYGKRRNVGHKGPPAKAGDIDLGVAAVAIAAGSDHTCALAQDGTVRCWGQGLFGALGYGNTNDIGDNEKPVGAGVVAIGGKAVRLSAGGMVSCALLASGKVRCWGSGTGGTLGLGHTHTVGDDETPASAPHTPIR